MDLQASARYTQVQRLSVSLGREQVDLVTKPGLPAWEVVAPSSQLFLEQAKLHAQDALCLMGCHLGAVAACAARSIPGVQITVADRNHTSLEMTRQTLAANQLHSARVLSSLELSAAPGQQFDVIYIQLPKGRWLARRWLAEAYLALTDQGSLYLAGANNSGIQSVIKDAAALFGNGTLLAYKKGNRIARFVKAPALKESPEWYREPGVAPGSWVEFSITLVDHHFAIHSLPGVFSHDHLDEGTRMLLSTVQVPPGSRVLDVGCGYGIIGASAAAAGAGAAHLVDNDLLAIASSRETLALNGITTAQVFAGDLLEPVKAESYDLILSNPPFHSGHAVDYQVAVAMIGQSYQALHPGGQLVIVANRFIRYDHLIASIFGHVNLLAESGKFFLLSGLKSG